MAAALNELIVDLDELSEPGDRIVVGPADLSRTIYSDVAVYYLFPELVPATYFIEMDPGLADAAGSGLAEDIESADWLVLTNFWTGWIEPNASAVHRSRGGQPGGRRQLLPRRNSTTTTSCCCTSAAKAAAA